MASSIDRLREAFRDPSEVMRGVGALMLEESQRSFRLQRLGSYEWPRRYPNQSEPFINIAGVVSDLSVGAGVKARRFQPRPALSDTKNLMGSLRDRSRAIKLQGTHIVEVGTELKYAAVHQWGGKSSQAITPTVRAGLAKFLRSKKGKPYRPKLGYLFRRDALTTNVNQRPFLGITDQLEHDIVRFVKDEMERKQKR